MVQFSGNLLHFGTCCWYIWFCLFWYFVVHFDTFWLFGVLLVMVLVSLDIWQISGMTRLCELVAS